MRVIGQNLLIAGCALTWWAVGARAQRIVGTVRDARAGTPVIGAPVSIVNAKGITVTRTLTDRAGTFALAVDSAGRTLQVRSVGFRPRDVAIADSARAGVAHMAIVLDRLPAVLDPVVSVAIDCPRVAGQGQALALWEQARFAFLASVVAREANAAKWSMLIYRGNGYVEHLSALAVRRLDTVMTRSFSASRSAQDFVTTGYTAVGADGGRTFFGPDADILMDDSFRATHCFDLAVADNDHKNQLGIAFTPAPGRTGMVDVSGVLWMDRSPLALRSLEYLYEGVDAKAHRAGIGGRLSFRTVDNGIVMVDAWQQRILAVARSPLPMIASTAGANYISSRPLAPSSARPDLQIDGAEVVSAVWPDGATVTRSQSSIVGTLVDNKTGKPMSGVTITAAAAYQTTTGDDGSFVLRDVLPGPYTVAASIDSGWAVAGYFVLTSTRVTVADDKPTRVTLQSPSLFTKVHDACNGRTGPGPGSLAGVVLDADGHKVASQIDVTFTSSAAGKPTTIRASGPLFAVCGLAQGVATLVATDIGGRHTEQSVDVVAGRVAGPIVLHIPR